MPRRVIRAVATIACLAAALIAPGRAAQARPDNPPGSGWISAKCATGALSGADFSDGDLLVYGQATACGSENDPRSLFAIVRFPRNGPSAQISAADTRPYRPSGPTTFGAWVNRYPATDGAAVCLMGSFHWRMACAEVTVSGITVTLRPIPLNDPLVSKPIDPVIYHSGTPDCGTCF